jgi:hypothetical protein
MYILCADRYFQIRWITAGSTSFDEPESIGSILKVDIRQTEIVVTGDVDGHIETQTQIQIESASSVVRESGE